MSGLVASRALVTSNISTVNSSNVPLAAGATFTGAAVPTGGYTTVLVTCYADASATLTVGWSSDRTNWDLVESFPVAASTYFSQRRPVSGVYVRTVITCGAGGGMTEMRLTTILTTANDGAEVSVALTNGDNVSVFGKTAANAPTQLQTLDDGTLVVADAPARASLASIDARLPALTAGGYLAVEVVSDSAHAQSTATNTYNIAGQLPASLGAQASAASLSVAPASDATFDVADATARASLASIDAKTASLTGGGYVPDRKSVV